MSLPRGNYYSFHEDIRVARVTILVDPTYQEWSQLMEQLFGDERYQRGSGILVDRRRAPVPRTKDVREIMRFVDRHDTSDVTRGWALVVGDLGSYGMGRMAQELSENENSLGVFRVVEDAVAWLVQRSHEPARSRRQLSASLSRNPQSHTQTIAALSPRPELSNVSDHEQLMKPIVSRIVSGGQTGADRAGLDWAMANDIPHGGYCPSGRIAEDGTIPDRYRLTELRSHAYETRTERNTQESDGTIIFTISPQLAGGSLFTANCATKHGKRALHVWAEAPRATTVEAIRSFVIENRIAILNVAGSRESEEPEIGTFVQHVLTEALLA